MQLTTITDTFELNNGLKMPKVGFGTWQTKPGKETYDAVSNALKAGYRFIDTATAYANEQSVGEAIADSDVARKDIFVQTKLPGESKTYDKTMADFDRSLKASIWITLILISFTHHGHGTKWVRTTMLKTAMSGGLCKIFTLVTGLSRSGFLTLTPTI